MHTTVDIKITAGIDKATHLYVHDAEKIEVGINGQKEIVFCGNHPASKLKLENYEIHLAIDKDFDGACSQVIEFRLIRDLSGLLVISISADLFVGAQGVYIQGDQAFNSNGADTQGTAQEQTAGHALLFSIVKHQGAGSLKFTQAPEFDFGVDHKLERVFADLKIKITCKLKGIHQGHTAGTGNHKIKSRVPFAAVNLGRSGRNGHGFICQPFRVFHRIIQKFFRHFIYILFTGRVQVQTEFSLYFQNTAEINAPAQFQADAQSTAIDNQQSSGFKVEHGITASGYRHVSKADGDIGKDRQFIGGEFEFKKTI